MAVTDILSEIVGGRSWREDAESFSESVGVTVAVLRSGAPSSATNARCPVCLLGNRRGTTDSIPRESCFQGGMLGECQDEVVTVCLAGMPCVLRRVQGVTPPAFVLVTGFLATETERKDLVSRLLVRRLPEREARAIARNTPVLRRRNALALARLASAHIEALLRAADVRSGTHDDGFRLELLYEMGRSFKTDHGDSRALCGAVLERALNLVSAESGAVMILGEDGKTLETMAEHGDGALRIERACRVGDTLAGHAAAAGRSMLVVGASGDADGCCTSSLAVPLRDGEDLMGVLVVVETSSGRALTTQDQRLMELFAERAAAAIADARRYREANERVLELMQLNELSKALHTDGEVDRISYLVTNVLDKLMDFEVGGLVLLGREEHARLVLHGDITRGDLAALLGEVTGMAVDEGFIDECALVRDGAQLLEGESRPVAKWTILSVDVSTSRPHAGFLFAASRDVSAFDAADERLLAAEAAHASVALEKARVYSRLRGELAKTVRALSAMLDATERTSKGHAARVMGYALAIGEEMGLALEDLETLRFAGLLHDVGKIGVSEEIILKPAKLTEDEMAQVRRHSEIGASLVDQMGALSAISPVILYHHERWDGRGYPEGISGEEIPLLARVLAVADAYDSMTSDRAYCKALPYGAARVEIERGAGTQFDAEVVAALLAVLEREEVAGATGLLAGNLLEKPQYLS